MPNWCSNTITISGNDIAKVRHLIENIEQPKESLFENTVGTFKDNYIKDGEFNWYDHNITEYGTKWDVDYFHFEATDDELTIGLETAWSPPLAYCRHLSERFDITVHISYSEQGCDFAGQSSFTAGEETLSETYSFISWTYLDGFLREELEFNTEHMDVDEFDEYVEDITSVLKDEVGAWAVNDAQIIFDEIRKIQYA